MTGTMIVGGAPRSTTKATPHTRDPRYQRLSPAARERAQAYFLRAFQEVEARGWAEREFLRVVEAVQEKTLGGKLDPTKISPPKVNDPKYFANAQAFEPVDQARYERIGAEAIRGGEVLQLDLVAGMATGFGGVAKAAVRAFLDTQFTDNRSLTYLDYKMERLLVRQRSYEKLQPCALMYSAATEQDILANLDSFGRDRNVNVVVIKDGTSSAELQAIKDQHEKNWENTIVVQMVQQPSILMPSSDGREVGDPYQKGHGDTLDVMQQQLKDFINVFGIKIIFVSNIDNIGGLVNEVNIGYLIEQNRIQGTEASLEAAEKYVGDKGGAPALLVSDNGTSLFVLEGPQVHKQLENDYFGREVFPVFNTNTLAFMAGPMLGATFAPPLFRSNKLEEPIAKIESIIAHGLSVLHWQALIIDRGERFLPAKYLPDLWGGRTDWLVAHNGVIVQAKENGAYVPKARIETGKEVLPNVATLDRRFFAGGSKDRMRELEHMIIGGEGKDFNAGGKMETRCPVRYVGNIAIVFVKGLDGQMGELLVESSGPNDTLTIENSLLVVGPGGRRISGPIVGQRDNIDSGVLQTTITEATKNWPQEIRDRFTENFRA